MDEPRHPVGPEIDDSGNPTAAAPEDAQGPEQPIGGEGTAGGWQDEGGSSAGGSTADAGSAGAGWHDEADDRSGGRRTVTGREMLTQLQQMIDTLAVQATPVLREVAAKAAELAAVAGEKAGPLAHRAAEATEKVGGRVAVRSKEMAAELRAAQAHDPAAPASGSAESAEDEQTGG